MSRHRRCRCSSLWGVKNPIRVRRNPDLQAKREFRPPGVSRPLTRSGMTRSHDGREVFETLKVALTAWLRLGESAGCAERVEGVLEVPPGLVADGDACHWRTNPPQSPTRSIDWCGVVQAVHLRSIWCNASGARWVRLSEMRTRDSAANRPHPSEGAEFTHPTGCAAVGELADRASRPARSSAARLLFADEVAG